MRRAALLAALVLAVVACATEPRTTYPAPGATPAPPGDRTAATVAMVASALANVGIPAVDSVLAYRPPEGALLAAAPRSVIQAQLPEDPTHGYIVVYALASPQAAAEAAEEQARYVATNRGGAFPFGARPVIRLVGSTVVFYSWIPESAVDPRTPDIETALATVGTEVPIVR